MNKRRKKKLKKKKKATLARVEESKSNRIDSDKLNSGLTSDQSKVVRVVFFIFLLGVVKQLRERRSADSLHTPPQLGEFALYMILSKEDREYLIGDLEEEFIEVQAKFGTKKARIWYYKQVFTSAWPLIRKALRFGLLTWIGEWIRRRI